MFKPGGELMEDELGTLAKYKTSVEPDDIETFKEDKVRVSMTHKAVLSLRDMLNRQYPPDASKEEKADD